ncbi:hypothetical protein HG536_0H00250 [Torulaspora globosa]|uniref:Peptidyl-tRNA hydrolase n=1 Tax=Torulaspora globosa TaxID=48254 RepID=A0A7G3ZMB5_9SACH|nr:uncharacterized protein HG536_0H00250 [Torulaspora globosa]QLL34651.1 hypothetical protein HG536_0H00250 [Torulaspora globosa]
MKAMSFVALSRPFRAFAVCYKLSRRYLTTCITGIGNPEPKYSNTRHNAGLVLLDLLKNHLAGRERTYKPCSNAAAKYLPISSGLILIRADGNFINLSGKTVLPLWRKLPQDKTVHIVAHDELSLPLGKVQLRKPGTSLRGHNGLKSIYDQLGNGNFYRLAVGIGRPTERDPAIVSEYVLTKFTPAELDVLASESLNKALERLKGYI